MPDPDGLAAAFMSRDIEGLRGFEVKDADGHVLFFGRPRPEEPWAANPETRITAKQRLITLIRNLSLAGLSDTGHEGGEQAEHKLGLAGHRNELISLMYTCVGNRVRTRV